MVKWIFMGKCLSTKIKRCCARPLASQPSGKRRQGCVMVTLDRPLSAWEPHDRTVSGTLGLLDVVMCSFPDFCTPSNSNKALGSQSLLKA